MKNKDTSTIFFLQAKNETIRKFSSRLLDFWKLWKSNSFTLKKLNGQAFRSAEVQKSLKKFHMVSTSFINLIIDTVGKNSREYTIRGNTLSTKFTKEQQITTQHCVLDIYFLYVQFNLWMMALFKDGWMRRAKEELRRQKSQGLLPIFSTMSKQIMEANFSYIGSVDWYNGAKCFMN